MRQHGFQRPFHWLQLLAAASTIATTGFFAVAALSLLPIPGLYYMSGGYFVVLGLTAGVWGNLIASDPTDTTSEGTKWCTHCNAFVNQRSRHCGRCQRCVVDLDHHCKWLNNCIGQTNYRRFVYLCLLFFSQASIEVSVSCIVGARLASDHEETEDLAKSRLGVSSNDFVVLKVLVGFVLFVAVFRAVVMLHLLGFHLYLWKKGMTTYAYILQNIRKKRPTVAPEPTEKEPKAKLTEPQHNVTTNMNEDVSAVAV